MSVFFNLLLFGIFCLILLIPEPGDTRAARVASHGRQCAVDAQSRLAFPTRSASAPRRTVRDARAQECHGGRFR